MTHDRRPLVILQVTPALSEGGVEQSTLEMASYIKAQGATPLVASAGGVGEVFLRREGIKHFRLSLNYKAPWFILWNMWKLRQIIRKYDVDIVHARSRAPAWSAWLALWLGDFRRVKFITTYHGTYGHRTRWKKLYNGVMLKGPLVIANSAFIKNHLMTIYNVAAKRIVVATRGVEPERYDPSHYKDSLIKKTREELGARGEAPLLLMVGRLTHWKGQHVLLEALGKLKGKPWAAAFVGSATQESYEEDLYAKAKKLGIADRVQWLGYRGDIPLLNLAADVAFSCSVQPEAFGRAAIEAQAMGTPAIASALGGSLETVKDKETGWLVPPGDADALARAIEAALKDAKRRTTMGKAARAWVLSTFTTETCCAAEWSAYQRLTSAH